MLSYSTQERRGREWELLERLVTRVEERGRAAALAPGELRQLGWLYRRASADLAALRGCGGSASVEYLNGVLRRCHALIADPVGRPRLAPLVRFYAAVFPRLLRAEAGALALAAAVFLLGALTGAGALLADPAADDVMIPPQHRSHSPQQRVAREEAHHGLRAQAHDQEQATFSAFLFTHNLQVSILAFALGLTFGLGTLLVLFVNGVPLGALAASYHLDGEGLFFWAWILPHGVLELTAIFIASAAGLVLARGLLAPGPLTRLAAARAAGQRALLLFLGVVPFLAIAALVEGTLSQLHAPYAPYWLKLSVAGALGLAALLYGAGAGRWFWSAGGGAVGDTAVVGGTGAAAASSSLTRPPSSRIRRKP